MLLLWLSLVVRTDLGWIFKSMSALTLTLQVLPILMPYNFDFMAMLADPIMVYSKTLTFKRLYVADINSYLIKAQI